MSKISELKKRFPEYDVARMSKIDPSGKNSYLDWMLKQRKCKITIKRIQEAVERFHKIKPSLTEKDIHKYKEFKDLESAIKVTTNSEIKVSGGVTTVVDSKAFKVLRLDEYTAASPYLKGTKWCISDEATFYDYLFDESLGSKNGLNYFLFINKNPVGSNYDKFMILSNDFRKLWDLVDDDQYISDIFRFNRETEFQKSLVACKKMKRTTLQKMKLGLFSDEIAAKIIKANVNLMFWNKVPKKYKHLITEDTKLSYSAFTELLKEAPDKLKFMSKKRIHNFESSFSIKVQYSDRDNTYCFVSELLKYIPFSEWKKLMIRSSYLTNSWISMTRSQGIGIESYNAAGIIKYYETRIASGDFPRIAK